MSDLILIYVSDISKVINGASRDMYLYCSFSIGSGVHHHKYVFAYFVPLPRPPNLKSNQLWKLARIAAIAKATPRDHFPPDCKFQGRSLLAVENFFSDVHDDVSQHSSERRLLAHRELRQREYRR